MKKIFITLGMAFLMLFSLVACNTDFDLAGYKVTAKAEIANYATEENYSAENWSIVCGIVDAGKEAVDSAENKTAVDAAISMAKEDINGVKKDGVGMFYSLQEAFDNGWLTKEDLQSIAYYLNDDSMPVYPNALSAKIEKAIKETRASNLRAETYSDGTLKHPSATADDITIIGYYGKYNDCFAVMLSDIYYDYPDVERNITINDVVFSYSNGNSILIWRQDNMNLETQAKQTYLDVTLKSKHPEATIDDVSFRPSLGIYNDSFVAVFYGGKYHGEFPDVEISYDLEGLLFAFSSGYPILVWNDGNICEIPEAYEREFLTKEDLLTINNLLYA